MERKELINFLLTLTPKERVFLFWYCRNRPKQRIMVLMDIQPGTYDSHLRNITHKLPSPHNSSRLKEEVCEDYRILFREESDFFIKEETDLGEHRRPNLDRWAEISIAFDDELKQIEEAEKEAEKLIQEAKLKKLEEEKRKEAEEKRKLEEEKKKQQEPPPPPPEPPDEPITYEPPTEPGKPVRPRDDVVILPVPPDETGGTTEDPIDEPQGIPRWVSWMAGITIIVIAFAWLINRCQPQVIPPATATRVPTLMSTSTQVVQVDPLTDTAVPIPPTDTSTPTITLSPTITPTPTNSPTPTESPTPTIAPTDVVVGPDNLPLKFEGEYKVPNYYPFDMTLYIEEKSGDRVSGKFQWPDRNNRFQGWEGNIVHDFGDVIEQSKWEQVDGFGSEGTYIKETRKWVISEGGGTDGNYYFYLSPTGRLTGVWFRHDRLTPEATIDLYISD